MVISNYVWDKDGENSQIPRFGKICGKLALFRKYLTIYHFFSTWVLQNWVLNNTRVPSESPAWHCWLGICVIKKNNMVLNITEIEYLFIVLEFSEVEYLVFLSFLFFFFFFFIFLLFVSVGMAWIVKLSGLTLANKPLNGLHAHIRKMHDIQEVSCVKKCKSLHWMFFINCQRRWPGTTPDMQTKFMLLFFWPKWMTF